ncbi:MAG: hypothetical protein ACI9C1_000932 [Candidatus Aldehydirespiratoraceae bacterium]|jgi:hypothetical protein
MPYVMVPVPEEHVEEVMQFMLKALARANQGEWDQDAVTRVFGDVDELSKTLLAHVARSTLAENEVFEADAAAAVQLSLRETAAIVRELNEAAREENLPAMIFRRPSLEVMPNGRTIEKTAIVIEEGIAPMILEAEKADLAANPLPG